MTREPQSGILTLNLGRCMTNVRKEGFFSLIAVDSGGCSQASAIASYTPRRPATSVCTE